MRGKKNRAGGTAPKHIQQSQSYPKIIPVANKINLVLGSALLAMQNPSHDEKNRSELLSVVQQIILIKCELGLYGGNHHAS